MLVRAEVSEYLLGVYEVRSRENLKQLGGIVGGKSEMNLSPQLNCGNEMNNSEYYSGDKIMGMLLILACMWFLLRLLVKPAS